MILSLFLLGYSDLGLLLAVIGVYVFFAALWLVYVTTERTAKGSAETEKRIERLRHETISELASARANRIGALTGEAETNQIALQNEITQLRSELATVREIAMMSTERIAEVESTNAQLTAAIEAHKAVYEAHLDEYHVNNLIETVQDLPAILEPDQDQPVVFKLYSPADEEVAEADDDASAQDLELGLVYYKRPTDPDDLTRIWGVGATNQDLLNENGVFYFRQVAAWNEKNVDKFNDILCFRGRIEREDWVGQAKRLASSYVPSHRDAAA